MKKKAWVIGVSAAVGAVLLGTGAWLLMKDGEGSKDGNIVYVNPVENLMNPGSGNGSVNRFAGVVETQEKLEIQPSQERTIKEIFVKEGDEVEVGTLLFSYDTEKAAEDLNRAKLDLERMNNAIENRKNELAVLEKEKKKAGKEAQLDYTIQIQSAQMELKQSEYERKSKQVEIRKLEDTLENAEVVSEMAGVVKSINNGNNDQMYYGGESQAFMTIIAMGNFRIKGKINEQNMGSVMPGQPVIIHSRVDENRVWKGIMGEVDMQNPGNDNNNFYYSPGDGMTQSNSYPFYVELESSDGLMLGQHVYMEIDHGQEEEKAGIWLDMYFVCDPDTEPYVWVDNGKGKLEKRDVVLGQFDENLFQYEIADGLAAEDMITCPEDGLKEGMKTARGENGRMGQSNPAMPEDDMINDTIPDEMIRDNIVPEGGMPDPDMNIGGADGGEMEDAQ